MVQTLFCSCLQHLELPALAFYFDIMTVNVIAIVFHLRIEKAKASDEQVFLEIKPYLARDIKRFALLFHNALFLLKSSIKFFLGENNLHGYSQSNFHPIPLADIHRSYLVYFQVCNMIKILRNKNRLTTVFSIAECCIWSFHTAIYVGFLKNVWNIVWKFT